MACSTHGYAGGATHTPPNFLGCPLDACSGETRHSLAGWRGSWQHALAGSGDVPMGLGPCRVQGLGRRRAGWSFPWAGSFGTLCGMRLWGRKISPSHPSKVMRVSRRCRLWRGRRLGPREGESLVLSSLAMHLGVGEGLRPRGIPHAKKDQGARSSPLCTEREADG